MNRFALSFLLSLAVGSTVSCSPAPADEGGGSNTERPGSGGKPAVASGGAGPSSGGNPGSGGSTSGSGGGNSGSGGGGGASSSSGGAGGAAPADAGSAPGPADSASEAPGQQPPAGDGGATTGLVKIFDGTSFDNWEYDPKAWVLKDGAMHGNIQGGQSQAFTKKDYSNFRLIVWSRMTAGNDHLGICLWGSRPAAGKYGFGGCLLVIPPNAAIWDYLRNQDHPKPNYQVGQMDWHKTEILANRTTGKVLVAVNGKLLHEYQDPPNNLPQRKNGPIGVQIHKAGAPHVEYKDIEIEVDPPNQQLITLTP
jgi:hypothetical protein